MAGIYIHIPFCKTRCIYCDFFSTTDEAKMDVFTDALCREIELRKGEITETVETIYWGGGTPSRLQQRHFSQIFDALSRHFRVAANAEITVEANPDDLSDAYIQMLAKLPFNRLSVGIQSFDDAELAFLNRRHSAQQAVQAVGKCQQAGFKNISIDLMYGLPNQTMETWQTNLQTAINLNIQHISAYHLIYEEKTRLHSLLMQNQICPVSDELSVEMFSTLISTLAKHGFEHYEISNFARNKLYSKHNTSYWQNKVYAGFGPSAHSFDGANRSWNDSSLSGYLRLLDGELPLREVERLSSSQRYNEFILTGLRTIWGVDLQQLKRDFGDDMYRFCLENAQKYIDQQLLTLQNDTLKLSNDGIFISDGIMSDLMWV